MNSMEQLVDFLEVVRHDIRLKQNVQALLEQGKEVFVEGLVTLANNEYGYSLDKGEVMRIIEGEIEVAFNNWHQQYINCK
ncbi:hypothetical protein [Halalkalibacter hemicellulosilyticus]|uniref:Uncharacterized protein n=1 Tax=Halalkalibacter hemicellulosilyticusJCM 9152 TaxID=1236971 RepID=W4QKB9_9BACI|nr:hypothetical protein [Halalkalibacter hemicellulosilyticus]GAE32083.1 hypothetical protein JCM9152_3599 [Halalkalibacter hemicellulosilyticusJCM 9152]